MTPKEKAKELYENYEFVYIQNYTSKHEVKQCALIAVDEIIDIAYWEYMESMGGKEKQYWQQVKIEIENL